jgi:hypothetical protein
MKRGAKSTFARRSLLAGAGGALLGLPFFESQQARAATFPKRLLIIYTPNGGWELPGGMDFAGSMLEPLEPFKQKLLLLRGLDMSIHNQGPGEPHQQGMAWLTGRPLNTGGQVGGDGSLAGWAQSISVDQAVADSIWQTAPTPRRSLHFGVQTLNYGGKEVRTVISYAGNNDPVSNEDDPWNMYETVFSQLGADPTGQNELRSKRLAVLDAVRDQLGGLAPKLGASDRLKLEQHLDGVHTLQTQLQNPGTVLGGSCQLPEVGSPVELGQPGNYPAIGKLQMDMLSMAFACDITRVATLQWSASTNNRPYPFLNYNGLAIPDEHILGHSPDSDTTAWGMLRVIRRWYAEQLAYLLGKLDSVQEGEGTMLDNTIVMLGSELSRGNTHSHMDAPFILAGGGGVMEMGRNLDYSGADVPHNNLLVALMNAMDVPTTTFGDPAYCNRPLDELWG